MKKLIVVLVVALMSQSMVAQADTAVVTSTERKYVIVIRDGKMVKVDVATGNETASKVEITGDLQPGEEVVAKANDETAP